MFSGFLSNKCMALLVGILVSLSIILNLVLVHVHLQEYNILVLLSQRLKHRCDLLAWPAPACSEIDNHEF